MTQLKRKAEQKEPIESFKGDMKSAKEKLELAAKAVAHFRQHVRYANTSLQVVKGFAEKVLGKIPEDVVRQCCQEAVSALSALPSSPEEALASIRDVASKHAKPASTILTEGCSTFVTYALEKLQQEEFSKQAILRAAGEMSGFEATWSLHGIIFWDWCSLCGS